MPSLVSVLACFAMLNPVVHVASLDSGNSRSLSERTTTNTDVPDCAPYSGHFNVDETKDLTYNQVKKAGSIQLNLVTVAPVDCNKDGGSIILQDNNANIAVRLAMNDQTGTPIKQTFKMLPGKVDAGNKCQYKYSTIDLFSKADRDQTAEEGKDWCDLLFTVEIETTLL